MTKQEREEKILKVVSQADEIKKAIYDIVWENQEGQPEHFDKMNKSEQVALVGVLNDACHLVHSLVMYQNWFIDKNK